ncbi:DEAD/DEAH box helicase family protein [Mycobacteroides abscessus MAB_030201_1061]|nr:DEAD/DEAH box helicase family protein [Mycobacteroides abscessus MAB_030201_1061]
MLARGKTGSGKTLGFSIPVVARIADGTRVPGRPRALVLAPLANWPPRSVPSSSRWRPPTG